MKFLNYMNKLLKDNDRRFWSMSKEKPVEWYDQADGCDYVKDDWYKRFKFIYTEMIAYLDKFYKVVDLGCGVGYIAKEILENFDDVDYLGIDFSKAMIKQARRIVPGLDFIVGDLRDPEIHKLYKPNYTYISMETLEHIENDIEVISSIPVGAEVLFSLPNFDSEAHVRWFKTIHDAEDRYNNLLSINRSKVVSIGPGDPHKIYMFKAKKI